MADKLRIGIVGAGGIVRHRHLPGFTAIDGVEIRAVSNRSRESSQAVAREWGIPHVVDDWRDLVCRDDIDIVVIGTWPYLHRDVTTAALAADKHVFCQARMTMNYADARHMYELSRLTDRVCALCPPPHHLAVDRQVREVLASGRLGELRQVRLQAMSSGGDTDSPPSWRQQAVYSGLNALTLGIWIEVIHGWCGYCREVYGKVRTWVGERPSVAGGTYQVSIPDSIRVLCEFESGAEGALEWSGVAHFAGTDRLELYGSRGTLIFNGGDDGIWLGFEDGDELDYQTAPPQPNKGWRVEENYIAAVRGEEEPITSFHAGLKYMEFIEAVYCSSRSGTGVRLPWGP